MVLIAAPAHRSGRITLTLAAKLSLHMRITQLVNHVRERHEVLDPERTPTGRHHDERIDIRSVRPTPRERTLHAFAIEERHAILTPRLANRHERKLATKPRVKRVRHPDSSLRNRPIERSRQPRRTRSPRASSTASKPSSSPIASGKHEHSSSSPSSNTSPGSTTTAYTNPSAISPQPSTNCSTSSATRPRHDRFKTATARTKKETNRHGDLPRFRRSRVSGLGRRSGHFVGDLDCRDGWPPTRQRDQRATARQLRRWSRS